MSEMPLFPLSAVLMPHGRIPLQIFEQRYLDLVRDCMKSNTGFGVVWLRRGSEVADPGRASPGRASPGRATPGRATPGRATPGQTRPGRAAPELGDYGTCARIVDWDQLPNGLLGITIEGGEVFELLDSHTLPSGLVMGETNQRTPPEPGPMIPAWAALEDVLRGLENHPHVQGMGLTIDYRDAWQVGYALAQLLPLEESVKYELLGLENLEELMRELDLILNQLSG